MWTGRSWLLPLSLVAAVILALAPSAALAHHKDGHTQSGGNGSQSEKDHDGDADSDPETLQTEPTNEEDNGDNRHPSRRDRSVENRTDANPNQGKSESDPDGDSNRGIDKPNGSGGIDPDDQDGNNGCGNDDDFEDDNNGNCGRPPQQVAAAEVQAAVEEEAPEFAPTVEEAAPVEVLGETIVNVSEAEVGAEAVAAAPEVLPAAERGALAVTGGAALSLVWLGLSLMLAGAAILRLFRVPTDR